MKKLIMSIVLLALAMTSQIAFAGPQVGDEYVSVSVLTVSTNSNSTNNLATYQNNKAQVVVYPQSLNQNVVGNVPNVVNLYYVKSGTTYKFPIAGTVAEVSNTVGRTAMNDKETAASPKVVLCNGDSLVINGTAHRTNVTYYLTIKEVRQ